MQGSFNGRLRSMVRRLRRFLALSRTERVTVLRRRRDFLLSAIIFGWPAARFNRMQRYSFLSYMPDAIREHGALPDLGAWIDAWDSGNARRNSGDLTRMLILLFNARKVITDQVGGDFAELGVYRGNSAKLLARLVADEGGDRTLHLFDTFGGFDRRDLTGIDEKQAAIFSDVSFEKVRTFIGHRDSCRYWPGYFPESAQELSANETFAFVHLDLDLYAPMKAGLEFFYPRLPSGAMMVLHDYSSGHWPGATAAVDEFLSDKRETVILMPDKSGTAIFRKL